MLKNNREVWLTGGSVRTLKKKPIINREHPPRGGKTQKPKYAVLVCVCVHHIAACRALLADTRASAGQPATTVLTAAVPLSRQQQQQRAARAELGGAPVAKRAVTAGEAHITCCCPQGCLWWRRAAVAGRRLPARTSPAPSTSCAVSACRSPGPALGKTLGSASGW